MRTILLLLFVASPLWAEPPSVKLPAELKGLPGEWIVISPEVEGGKPRWRLDPGLEEVNLAALFGDEIAAKAKGKVVKAARGRYRAECWNAKDDKASDIAVCWVIVGDPSPQPGPGPGPQPQPQPGPQPVPITGFRVLMLYDEQAPSERWNDVLFAKEVETYLNAKCTKDGNQPGYRRWDDDEHVAGESEVWRQIYATCKPHFKGEPLLFVIRDQKIEQMPLPETVPLAIEALKRYGG